jgi:hypothetical protein
MVFARHPIQPMSKTPSSLFKNERGVIKVLVQYHCVTCFVFVSSLIFYMHACHSCGALPVYWACRMLNGPWEIIVIRANWPEYLLIIKNKIKWKRQTSRLKRQTYEKYGATHKHQSYLQWHRNYHASWSIIHTSVGPRSVHSSKITAGHNLSKPRKINAPLNHNHP